MPIPLRLLAGIVFLLTPLAGGGILGGLFAQWAWARLVAARCQACGGAARQEPRALWGLGYVCSVCGARLSAPSPGPWLVAGACGLVGVGLAALPFLPIPKSRSLDAWTSLLMVVTGLVVLQFGLLAAGLARRLVSRSTLLKGADLSKLAVGALLVTSFALTAVGASVGGGLIYSPGAVLLLAMAGRLWWKALTESGRPAAIDRGSSGPDQT